MHCTLPRTQSDLSGIFKRRKSSLPLLPLEQSCITTSEDCTESPVIWRSINNSGRCGFLTFLTFECNGNCKILAVPVQYPDNTNNPAGHSQYTGRSSSGSRIRSQPHCKAIQSSSFFPDEKAERTAKTGTNKKVRKKRKQGKKLLSNGGSADILSVPSPQSDLQDSRSSNSSSELDTVLVSSDGDEGLKIDSGASNREAEARHREPLNLKPGQKELNDAIDLADQRDETRRGSKRNAAKKSSRAKAVVNIPCDSRSGVLGKSHAQSTGKENGHPVWQKVERKVETENDSMKVNCKTLELNEPPSNGEKKQLSATVSGKFKRKHFPSSKQENNRQLRKGSSANRRKLGSSNKSASSNSASVPEITSCTACYRLISGEAEKMKPEPLHGSYTCSDGLQLNGDSSNSMVHSGNEHMEDWDSSLGESRVDPNITSPPPCLPQTLANGDTRSDKENAHPEHCRQKSISGSVTQKWVPIGTKLPASTGITSEPCISVEHGHLEGPREQASDLNTENTAPEARLEQTRHVRTESTVPSSTLQLVKELSPQEKEEQIGPTKIHNTCKPEEQNKRVVPESLMSSKGQLETDLDRIARAVDNAHRAQLASEAVQMATGGPIADFERLLHLCSPVLCLSNSISSCSMRLNHSSPSPCMHDTPDISLGCVWQWYQKHGSFGLEVRGKDYNNSKRLGIDRFSFRAYFVPYLSAVQLFRTSKNSTVGELPMLPMPIPGAEKDVVVSHTAESAESREPELIFEYFELEQPQQRRPFYEKIQELVRGDGPSGVRAYGDPSELNSLNLQDLDPRSWYTVAWYPIYRIPDGNFRASFLTYHSLGHFVRRNGVEDSVVSPVVGLQSYNAQGECWFQLRPSVSSQASQIPSLDPSKVLAEQLRTLEEAARSMSRATVSKSNTTSLNRHPDYEFFLSRQRYC